MERYILKRSQIKINNNMNTINIQLTPEQIKNLLVFLNRVQLQGNEAEVLVQLKIILNNVLRNLPPVANKEDKKGRKQETK